MYSRVVSSLRCPAYRAISWMSIRARAMCVSRRCLGVWVVKRGTLAFSAMRCTALDHEETERPRLRFESERKSGPASLDTAHRSRQYAPRSVPVTRP
jgi:hypothetical protein